MDINSQLILDSIMPSLRNLILIVLGAGLCFGVWWYLFVVLKRRKWHVEIWEEKADGALYLVDKDLLIERKFNKGKQTAYILKFAKAETLPPPADCAFRLGKKEYAYYMRVLDDYVPLSGNMKFPDSHNEKYVDRMTGEQRSTFIKKLKDAISNVRNMSYVDVQNKYIYAPIKKDLIGKVSYKTMDYDVNMMRINALDNREKIYADTKGWIEKYGQYLVLGGLIVLIIVVLYLSYDYSKGVLEMAFSQAGGVSGKLDAIVTKLGGMT